MKRRPKGTGTTIMLSDGRCRALFPFVMGRGREEIDGSPFPSKQAAEEALDGLLAVLAETGAARGGVTLKSLGRTCLDRREKEGYRAVKSERSRWAAYVEPWAQYQMPARDLTRGHIRQWLASLAAQGLATQTRRNALNLLRAVLECGVEDELIPENVARTVKVKHHGSTRETSTFLTQSEALALVTASGQSLAVCVAIGAGVRGGEQRSLHWDDVHVDAERPHLVVRYGKPGLPTKSGRIRTVPLFGVALEALCRVPKAERKGKVFPALRGGYRSAGRVVDAADWRAWLAAAQLVRRVRWQDLRHTCATLLLTGDMPGTAGAWTYEQVKDMLGHSSVKVTERYARSIGLAGAAAATERDSFESAKLTTGEFNEP